MDEQHLKSILGRLGIRNVPRPNHAGWVHVPCPYARWTHKSGNDRSAGFAIKVEKDGISAFNCPVCKRHGRISYLAQSLGVFHQRDYHAVATDADMADLDALAHVPSFEEETVDLPPLPLEDAIFDGMFEDPWTIHNQHPEAAEFLKARGVSPETSRKLELGYDPEKKRIVFPVRGMQGELYGFSGRTVINHKAKVLDYEGLPKRWLILGTHLWRHDKPVVMVEGLFAYAHFHEIGADEHFNIGALLGSFLTPEKAAILKGFDQPVYWFTDPDPAGDDCLYGRVILEQVNAPTEEDDPDDQPELPRDTSTGALYIMNGHVPQYVPSYPTDDPDDLTRAQFDWMVQNAELWLPPAAQVG